MSGWTDDFKPVVRAGDHRWRINDGDTSTHGYGVICDRCRLELVPCVDLVGLARKRGRCRGTKGAP